VNSFSLPCSAYTLPDARGLAIRIVAIARNKNRLVLFVIEIINFLIVLSTVVFK
jgi:hypothetical protein